MEQTMGQVRPLLRAIRRGLEDRTTPQHPDRARECRPRLERHECRLAPATYYWNGAGNNANMSNGNNYVGAPQAINAGDTLVFDGAGGGNANNDATADAGLPASVASVQLTNGYQGDLRISRNLTVSLLTKDNARDIRIDAGLTLIVTDGWMNAGRIRGSGTFQVGDATGGSFAVNGTSTFNATSLVVSTNSNLSIAADLAFSGNQQTWTNNGGVNWAGGNISSNATGVAFTNAGTFQITGLASGKSFTPRAFDNSGLVQVSLPVNQVQPATLLFLNNLSNPNFPYGVEVQSGKLELSAGTSITPIKILADGELRCDGDFAANAGTAFDGAGKLTVASGTFTVAQNTILQVEPLLIVDGGTVTGRPVGQNNVGDLRVQNYWFKGGGLNNAFFRAASGGSFAGNFSIENVALTLYGTTTWDDGAISVNDAWFTNYGTFTIKCDVDMTQTGGNPSFTNTSGATLEKTIGNGHTLMGLTLYTAGTVRLGGTEFHVSGGVVQTGGTVDLGGGTLDLKDRFGQLSTYRLEGGTLKGKGNIKNGALNNLDGTAISTSMETLTLDGDYNQSGGTLLVSGGSLNVSGAFVLSGGSAAVYGGPLEVGSYRQSGGDFTVQMGATLLVDADFQVDAGYANIQWVGGTVSGAMHLNGGTVRLYGYPSFTVSAGVFVGQAGYLELLGGVLAANVSNSGHIRLGSAEYPSAEEVTIDGDFTQTATGRLTLDASPYAHDRLTVTGTATLDGVFELIGLNGFDPAPFPGPMPYYPSFELLRYGARSGTFASYDLPTLSSGTWDPRYDDPLYPNAFSLWVI